MQNKFVGDVCDFGKLGMSRAEEDRCHLCRDVAHLQETAGTVCLEELHFASCNTLSLSWVL